MRSTWFIKWFSGLKIKIFRNIRNTICARYIWINESKSANVVSSKGIYFLRHLFIQILRNLQAYSNIFASHASIKPVSVVSVNFDHRTVTLFWDKCHYWQTSIRQYWYCIVCLVFRGPSKLGNISSDCSILIIRIYTSFLAHILKIYKVLTLNMINVITLLVVVVNYLNFVEVYIEIFIVKWFSIALNFY